MKKLIGILIFLNGLVGYSQPLRLSNLNLDHFSIREKKYTSDFSDHAKNKFFNHPEYGLMPFETPPCRDCYERIDKRDAYTRYFEKGVNRTGFVIQKALTPINYTDRDGNWREINPRLEKKSGNNFIAPNQPYPVSIDLDNYSISIRCNEFTIHGRIPELLFVRPDGTEKTLGNADLSYYTAGDDGIKIIDFYPGIDLVISVKQGEVETSFVLNNRLSYSNGTIVLRQQFNLPDALTFDQERINRPVHREISILDITGNTFFKIENGFAFDNNLYSAPLNLYSRIVDEDVVEFIVPVSWLNDPATVYPVIIDPVIMASGTLALPSIAGTKFSPVCWTNGCDYFLNVATPPNSTVTKVYHSFEFYATGLCYSDDGGYSIDYQICHAPSAAPGVYTNAVHITNAYFTADTVLIPDFNSCLPAPSCSIQNMGFTLHFYRCNNDPDTTCSANCIRATKPWTMFVEGNTVEISYLSSNRQVCEGSAARLVVVPQYGVGPYSYVWSPGASTDDTVFVSPAVTTSYSVVITDACGITASGSTSVNVTADNNPGFTVSPNPACENTAVTLNGNGSGAATDYDWILPGSNAPSGILNDMQSPSVSYNLPGTFDVILSFQNGTCTFRDTQQIVIEPVMAASVTLSSLPTGTICQGDTVVFTASGLNGGIAPVYDWFINGVFIQSGTADTFVTSTLNNGSSVQVIFHSVAACTSPLADTASLFVSVSSSPATSVSISPDTIVCTGSSVTLNALPVNGGSTPSYQWFLNGNPVPGANASSFTFTVTPPDTIVSILVNSSLNCVASPIAYDTSIVSIYVTIQPVVTITADPPGMICSGDSVTFTANSIYGGNNPQYQWYVNGNPVGTNSMLTITPANNDSISVRLTSSLTCATPASDDEFLIASVASSVNPSVTVTASPSNIICQDDTIVFTGHALNAGVPSFNWIVNGISTGVTDSIFSSSALNDNDLVEVIVSSSLSCSPLSSDTDRVVVSVSGNTAPTVEIVPTGNFTCEGEQVEFTVVQSNGGPAPVYQWTLNGVPVGFSNDTIAFDSLLNADTLRVLMTSSLACVSPTGVSSQPYLLSLQARVSPLVTITSDPVDTICIGQEVIIHANVSNEGTTPEIRWYVNSMLIPETSNEITSSAFGPGDVIFASLKSNAECLITTDDTSNIIRIVYFPPLDIQLSTSPPDCPGEPATVYAHVTGGNGGPYHLLWSTGSEDTDSITLIAERNTKVLVQAEDNCTVSPATNDTIIPVLTGPVADYSYSNPAPSSFLNDVQFVNLSQYADTWTWYFPDDQTVSTELNPLHRFPEEGTYEVLLVTTNNNGCVDSIIYSVSVREEISVFYPNSFTPNGDGMNDYFQPVGASLEDYELTIWDRWGELIYEGNSKMSWNGLDNNTGSPAAEGVYIFRIDLLSDKFEEKVVTGRVSLIR